MTSADFGDSSSDGDLGLALAVWPNLNTRFECNDAADDLDDKLTLKDFLREVDEETDVLEDSEILDIGMSGSASSAVMEEDESGRDKEGRLDLLGVGVELGECEDRRPRRSTEALDRSVEGAAPAGESGPVGSGPKLGMETGAGEVQSGEHEVAEESDPNGLTDAAPEVAAEAADGRVECGSVFGVCEVMPHCSSAPLFRIIL